MRRKASIATLGRVPASIVTLTGPRRLLVAQLDAQRVLRSASRGVSKRTASTAGVRSGAGGAASRAGRSGWRGPRSAVESAWRCGRGRWLKSWRACRRWASSPELERAPDRVQQHGVPPVAGDDGEQLLQEEPQAPALAGVTLGCHAAGSSCQGFAYRDLNAAGAAVNARRATGGGLSDGCVPGWRGRALPEPVSEPCGDRLSARLRTCNFRVQFPDRRINESSVPAGQQERRRRILEAATRLFAEAPYDAVQVDDIARVAQVAKPTLYRYFDTKERLFVEALEGTLDELRARVAAIARGTGPADARLRAVIEVMFAEIGRLKALIRALDSSAGTLGDRGRAVLRRELRHLRGEIALVLRDGASTGLFAAVDPDVAALVVLGGVRMSADLGGGDPARTVDAILLEGLLAR